jgi:hypothetical protein
MKLRIAQLHDGKHQSYVCRCRRAFHFEGTVLALHVSAVARPFHNYDWIGVPDHKITPDDQRQT